MYIKVCLSHIAAVQCVLSLMAYEAANTRIENKVLDSDSV